MQHQHRSSLAVNRRKVSTSGARKRFGDRILLGQLTPRRRLPELVFEERLQLHLGVNRLATFPSELRPGDQLVVIAGPAACGVEDPRVGLEPHRDDLPDERSFARGAERQEALVDPHRRCDVCLERHSARKLKRHIHARDDTRASSIDLAQPPAASRPAPPAASGPPRSRSAARRRRGSSGSPRTRRSGRHRSKSGSIRTWSTAQPRSAAIQAIGRQLHQPSSRHVIARISSSSTVPPLFADSVTSIASPSVESGAFTKRFTLSLPMTVQSSSTRR